MCIYMYAFCKYYYLLCTAVLDELKIGSLQSELHSEKLQRVLLSKEKCLDGKMDDLMKKS